MRGKFIVFEGTDGSGKTTQISLFLEFIKEHNISYVTYDFPQYEEFWGQLVGRFLAGEFGDLHEVSPYLVAPIYALDQASRNDEIRSSLDQGVWVISNRYASSTMAHQGSKFKSDEEKKKFLEWFSILAYEKLGIVKDDLTYVLYADPSITQKLAKEGEIRKKYLNGKSDIAECNTEHQIRSANEYRSLVGNIDSWELVDCMKNGRMDTIKNIQKKIRDIASLKFNIFN